MDMHLLDKGPAPKDAFAGKVVWITGASQVRLDVFIIFAVGGQW